MWSWKWGLDINVEGVGGDGCCRSEGRALIVEGGAAIALGMVVHAAPLGNVGHRSPRGCYRATNMNALSFPETGCWEVLLCMPALLWAP